MQPEDFSTGSTQCRYFALEGETEGGGFCEQFCTISPSSYANNSGLVAPATADGLALQGYCGSSSSSSPSNVCPMYDATSSRAVAVSATTTTTATTPDEKTILALRNHKEAERRRRKRINSHLECLRSLIPCSTKTDKATLLARVVQRVRELNQETSEITSHLRRQKDHLLLRIPSLNDEFSVDPSTGVGDNGDHETDDEKLILKASVCCEDRPDLLADLIEAVNSLNLKTLRAEILSLGGRTRNELVLSGDCRRSEEYVAFLHDALKGIVQRSGPSSRRAKRPRRLDLPQLR